MRAGPAIIYARHLDNARLALKLWEERVKPRQVELDTWRCGTQACFGGWLVTWPEFKAMGVKTCWDGAPYMPDAPGIPSNSEVAAELFGEGSLFWSRGTVSSDDSGEGYLTDHAVIVLRLKNHISKLETWIGHWNNRQGA